MDEPDNRRYENPNHRAAREGRESAEREGTWRDCPYTPGTRQFYEWCDGYEDVTGRNPYAD